MKILVFTVSAWNSKVGANSWATLLEQYDSSCIANICIRDEIPDSKVCSRYFNISENRIIESVLNRKIKTGRELTPTQPTDCLDLEAHRERYQKMTVKRRYSMLMARELIWKLGRWKTPELDAFLDDFKPDIILHSMEGYIHLNRIIRYAIKRTGAKAVGYIWDDNFTYKQSDSLGYKLYRFFQSRSLKKLASDTGVFFAISQFTKEEADEFFKINCKVLTKPLSNVPKQQFYTEKYPISMIYTGNLLIGRDKSLIRLINAIKEVNRDRFAVKLDIYTQTVLNEETLAKLNCDCCAVHESIPQSEVLEKQRQSDILLFLEDIDGKHAKTARLSFSTKITDYLSTGKCIFAVGNSDTAPIKYFIQNKAAVVCDSDESILKNLKAVTADFSLMNGYAENARKAAVKNHDPEAIRNLLFSTLEDLYKGAN